jgi:hypothetical protein
LLTGGLPGVEGVFGFAGGFAGGLLGGFDEVVGGVVTPAQ